MRRFVAVLVVFAAGLVADLAVAAGTALAVVAGAASVAATAFADEPATEEVLRTTAGARGSRYAVGRDALLARGDAAVAVARRHLDDADAGTRALARLVLLRHERPDDCATWAKLLGAQAGTVEVTAGNGAALVRAAWGPPDRAADAIPAAAVPLVIDVLRDVEDGPRPSAPETAARVAGALRAADCAPWLAALLPPASFGRREVADALVAIGEPSIPPVRALLDGDLRWSGSSSAIVLGRLGDRASASRLVELLRTSGHRELVPACGEALLALAPAEGAAAAVERLATFRFDAIHRTGGDLTYVEVRATATAFGGVAVAAANALRALDPAPSERARLDGIVWELTHVEDAARLYETIARDDPERSAWQRFDDDADEAATIARLRRAGFQRVWSVYTDGAAFADHPVPLVVERAAALGTRGDLVRAARLGTPLAAEVVRDALLTGWARRDGGAEALHALAESSPDAALDVLDAWAGAEPPRDLARAAEALFLLLDRPRSREIAERIAARASESGKPKAHVPAEFVEAAPIATAVGGVIRGDRRLADVLSDPSPGVRLAAARALARRGDPAGVTILADAAVAARGADYAALRDDLVRAGRAPDPGKDDLPRRVLAAAVAARIADPAVADAFLAARRLHEPFTLDHLGLQPEHYAASGSALAKVVGERARPLLDERATFLGDRVSIRALGALGGEASIDVLVQAARHQPGDAAEALRALGEKGLAAAGRVPPPDPAKPRFGERASRHLGATEAVEATPEAVGKALEGLAEPRPAASGARDEWASRMQRYLRVAGRSGDARIVGPALAVLAASDGNRHLADAALEALSHVRDPRVAEACLAWLPAGQFDQERPEWGEAHATLRFQLGDGLWPFLTERFAKAPPGRDRFALAHALFRELLAPARTAADRDAAAAALRVIVAGDDRGHARDAAFDLVRLQIARAPEERRPADDAALLSFLRRGGDLGLAADEVPKLGLPGTAAALLDGYRNGRDFRALGALASLGHEPAVPEVLAGLREAIARPAWTRGGWTPPEFRALVRLGAAGRDAARQLAEKDPSEAVRDAAVRALAESGDVSMFERVLALLDTAETKGAADFDSQRRLGGLVWLLETMDPRRAVDELVRRALASKDPALAGFYAVSTQQMRRRHPAPGAGPAPR